MKIAILYIATGRYTVFWKDFYKNCEKYFLPNHEKTYFIFTDSEEIKLEKNVVKINQPYLGWPYDTLMRFDMFMKVEEQLKEFDYIYFMNATMFPVATVGEEVLPTDEQGLMVMYHPGYYKCDRSTYNYDENPQSLAYIPKYKGEYYFMGCFNGGTAKAFLKLIKDLDSATKKDLEKGIIALWHDESHLNKYMLDKKPLIVTPEYGFPEGMPFNQENLAEFKNNIKILIKDKGSPKYGGHAWLRGVSDKKRTWFKHYVIKTKRKIESITGRKLPERIFGKK